LAQLLLYRPEKGFIASLVEPNDEAVPEDVQTDFEQSLQVALASRAEIQASAHGVQAQQLNEKIASNALLPRLDAVGTLGGNGLSGSLVGPRCQTVTRPDATVRTASFTNDGPIHDAYRRIDDFPSYTVGLKLEDPLANATTEAQAAPARTRHQH